MNIKDVRSGNILRLDSGFTCREEGDVMIYHDNGGLYFVCDKGHHYLSGQADEDGELVGIKECEVRKFRDVTW